ncbi:hypothetical protein AQ837_24490 [Burkholderia pseudomallei]|nr:hypothetical protein AQ730_00505 [Burkholderia pseudomallei]OMS89877.1 hypothetical protein AQ748_04490 [Burkholderia pseudomallei]OMU99875.1 hypothetical protein AQ784_05325 [Burkholderia pseudomallei]OMV08080.1 hypothetical protein AQ785_26685 [Burkholderia pseudomallei]OMW55960.1 hypothetical protein AQ812_16205 [Burkholderia pseudomallei]
MLNDRPQTAHAQHDLFDNGINRAGSAVRIDCTLATHDDACDTGTESVAISASTELHFLM